REEEHTCLRFACSAPISCTVENQGCRLKTPESTLKSVCVSLRYSDPLDGFSYSTHEPRLSSRIHSHSAPPILRGSGSTASTAIPSPDCPNRRSNLFCVRRASAGGWKLNRQQRVRGVIASVFPARASQLEKGDRKPLPGLGSA